MHVLVVGFCAGIGAEIRHFKTHNIILIGCLIVIYTLCIIKAIRKKMFYLYFKKEHISYMVGKLNTRYNKILINKFDNSLILYVGVESHIRENWVNVKFDYLRYSKDIRKINKSKNQERDLLLFIQKLGLANAFSQELKEKLTVYNRKEKIKSIL
jgi:hypothetical protein